MAFAGGYEFGEVGSMAGYIGTVVVALQALHVAIDELKKEPSLRNAKMAGDLAAKLLMKEVLLILKWKLNRKV